MWFLYFILGVAATRCYYRMMCDVVEDPKINVQESNKKIAYIEKIDEGKFFVYDKSTHQYLCKFISWKQVSESLNDIDGRVDWIVEHNHPEIDRKTMGE